MYIISPVKKNTDSEEKTDYCHLEIRFDSEEKTDYCHLEIRFGDYISKLRLSNTF